jgi:ABC-type Fe3+ transport system substrate-binding protein
MFHGCPYATLAWHYLYGVGCKKNIEEARKLMRWTCTKDGEYWYPAYKQMIKDMGLDGELKYNPKLGEPADE